MSSRRIETSATTNAARQDIQALRAIAVVAVILDHLLHWPQGGFVGVDIFFVLSGFLITGLLLREHDRSGRISFSDFYRRRVKRIMPAAVLVLTVTVAASYIVFSQTRWISTVGDAVASLFFSQNWRLAVESTDYFAQGQATSPLQHFWSLGVEEQFYLVWPWVMVAVFAILLRTRISPNRTKLFLGGVIAVITIASFVWAMWESTHSSSVAYFSTFSRAWELGVGATAAIASPLLGRIPKRLRPYIAWAGVGGLAISFWVVGPATIFPAPGALLPVLATVLVIIAGIEMESQKYLFPLITRPVTYAGDISYSLYLWHFPIIILATTVWGESPIVLLLITVAIGAVSVWSYELVEDPIRKSAWLNEKRNKRNTTRLPRVEPLSARVKIHFATFAATVILGAFALTFIPNGTDSSPVADIPIPVSTDVDDAPLSAILQREIVDALRATSYPSDLSPTMDEAVDSAQTNETVRACGIVGTLVDTASCTWGDPEAAHRAFIVGDSVSMTYVGPLAASLPSDWSLTSVGTFACPFTDFNRTEITGEECIDRKIDAVNMFVAEKPDVVFIANSYWQGALVEGGETPSPAEWAENLTSLTSKFSDSVGKVVFLAAPPSSTNPNACYSRLSTPADCRTEIVETWRGLAGAELQLAADLEGQWVDSSDWFCVQNQCPIFVGKIPVRSDLTHMTVEYGLRIAPVIGESFAAQNIWDS